jgi:hypothetical protein
VRVRMVHANRRKKAFDVSAGRRRMSFPFARSEPAPSPDDPVARVYVDPELACQGFSYVLESGREGTVHVDQVLEYNQDPVYLRNLLLYKLTIEARRRVETSPLAKRELVRRLGTSPTQFYRLLDPANDRKSIDQMLRLLQVLDCEIDLVVREKRS